MNKKPDWNLIAIIGVCVALAAVPIVLIGPRLSMFRTQSAYVPLVNPDFEDGFRNYDDIGELTVANGLAPWYVEDGVHHRPEYKPEPLWVNADQQGHVLNGEWGQKQFTTYSTHDGGVYQQVPATPGQWYTFSAWVWVWSQDRDGPPRGKYSALVGINPWGDCRATYRTTVWGQEALEVYDQWVQVSVTAQAWSDTICVFTRGTCEYAVKHNDSYWDELRLVKEHFGGDPEPLPTYTPRPTYTPYPTTTPQPTYTPAPTCVPCPTCSPVTPAPGGCPNLEEQRVMVREELERILELVRFIPVMGRE